MNIQDQLGALNRGRLFTDVEEAMADVLDGVKSTRKKGTVTITVTLGMEGREEDQLNVTAKVAKKRPMHDPAATTMFLNDDMTLTTKDPKQRDFGDILDVGVQPSEVIDPTSGEVTSVG